MVRGGAAEAAGGGGGEGWDFCFERKTRTIPAATNPANNVKTTIWDWASENIMMTGPTALEKPL